MNGDIVWLRDDFRLDDQPAILAAADRPALHIYIHDNSARNGRPPGGAAKWRLARSLKAMEERLAARGGRLDVIRGDSDAIIVALAAAANASRVLWTRRYEGASIALDGSVKTRLRERGVEALSFNGRLMREPWEAAKPDGAVSGSFSAFWRRHRALGPLPSPSPAPDRLYGPAMARAWAGTRRHRSARANAGQTRLVGRACAWRDARRSGRARRACPVRRRRACTATRTAATKPRARQPRASRPICASGRFRPAASPPRWRPPPPARPGLQRDAEKFIAELGWRDFAAALLFAHPEIATRPLRQNSSAFPGATTMRAFAPGRRGGPAIRSSTPGCASSGAPDPCTIACG